VVAVSSCQVWTLAASCCVIRCQVAASSIGLMGFLGWYWGKPIGIVVSCGLEFAGTAGRDGFCTKLCIAGSGGMVIASSAMLVVDCGNEDGLCRL